MKTIKKSEMTIPELMLNTIIEYFESIGITQNADIMRNIMRWNHEDLQESEGESTRYFRALMELGNLVSEKVCQQLAKTPSIDKDYIDLLCCIDRLKKKGDIPFDMHLEGRIKNRWDDLALEYGED